MTAKCRYQEALDGGWYLTVYGGAGKTGILTEHTSGPTAKSHPAWLDPILVTAAAAEAFIQPDHPPPYRVLWFYIDGDYNLLRFGHD